MKRVKKDIRNFNKLNSVQMGSIKGGTWIEYTDEKGNVIRVRI